MSGRDMHFAKKEIERINSLRKKGEIKDADKIKREHLIVCGCGDVGCIFTHFERDEKVSDE